MDAGSLLRELREERGVAREELAARAGVDVGAVAAAEEGEGNALARLFSAWRCSASSTGASIPPTSTTRR
jgi:transcriptional regulator with XRE-family HTH domain